jgi:predicted RNase H-like HicB family nuclease
MEDILEILATWDSEASVWVAESDDVPGLAAEADSIPALLAKLKVLVPEMLEENGQSHARGVDIPFRLQATVLATAPCLTD